MHKGWVSVPIELRRQLNRNDAIWHSLHTLSILHLPHRSQHKVPVRLSYLPVAMRGLGFQDLILNDGMILFSAVLAEGWRWMGNDIWTSWPPVIVPGALKELIMIHTQPTQQGDSSLQIHQRLQRVWNLGSLHLEHDIQLPKPRNTHSVSRRPTTSSTTIPP